MIAGRFIGRQALAAEGIGGPVINLVILAVTDMCIGAGVLMSEAFGAKMFDQLRKTLAATLRFGAVICCTATALGIDVIAAFNAVTRVDDFACVPEMSLSSAISTYIAQNRGAKKMERVRSDLRAGIRLELGYWVLIACAVTLLRTPIVALFVTEQSAREIVALGSRYLRYMAFFYLIPALDNSFQGFYRGMGKMLTTMLGTLLQISVRTLGTALLAPRMGIEGVAFACGAGWLAMLLFEMPYFFITCRKKAIPR